MVPRWWNAPRASRTKPRHGMPAPARRPPDRPAMDFDLELDPALACRGGLCHGLAGIAAVDLRQLRIETARPQGLLQGLNHLLNEQQDQAIDAFIEAVQNDPDTSELHFASGQPVSPPRRIRTRRAGARAPAVTRRPEPRPRPCPACLALDYLKAGCSTAPKTRCASWRARRSRARRASRLLAIHERSRDWAQASLIARKLDASGQGLQHARGALSLCEQAANRPATPTASRCCARP